ncbi:transposase [Streptomyces sp. 4N124]|uniref:transposase n=1 Tax=Streptomyces sp. 4N124 TaxID=3457420 RepID=UPI003FCF9DB7
MVHRHELSDAEWEFVRPLLPAALRSRKRLDDRTVLNGIVWKFRTRTARTPPTGARGGRFAASALSPGMSRGAAAIPR